MVPIARIRPIVRNTKDMSDISGLSFLLARFFDWFEMRGLVEFRVFDHNYRHLSNIQEQTHSSTILKMKIE